jgi:hypothetical protein
MGFTLDEVQRLKNYEVVFAFPIVRITTSGLATAQPHCVGVLSVDCADEDFDHVSRPDDTFTRLSWHAHRHGTLLNEFLEDLRELHDAGRRIWAGAQAVGADGVGVDGVAPGRAQRMTRDGIEQIAASD